MHAVSWCLGLCKVHETDVGEGAVGPAFTAMFGNMSLLAMLTTFTYLFPRHVLQMGLC